MREILFRGKTDKGEWVQGVPFFEEERYYIIEDLFVCDEYNCTGAVNSTVIPETVGQYTGLTDKNGKKIFEGDIVKLFYKDGFEIGLIGWSNIDFRYKFASPDGTAYGFDVTDIFEVIGNIHDNPELLKGGEG